MKLIKECLKPIMGNEVSDDIVSYIVSITQEEDYHDFMENVVDKNNSKHMQMYEKLKQELFGCKYSKNKSPPSTSSQHQSNEDAAKNSGGKGKKTKYTNFYSKENKPGLRKGRHPCDCQASKHELINNCTKCGRIVCEQEGSGPCLFCDNMVCTRYEMEILQANSKESDRLYNHLLEQKKSNDFKRALENRNRLIQTDQLGVVKNKVFDDQNDYFDLNGKWADDNEKETMKKRYRARHEILHKSRKEFKLALDFASRTVSLNDESSKQKQQLLKGVNKLLDNADNRFPKNLFEGDKGQLIGEIVRLMEESKISGDSTASIKKPSKETTVAKYRIANNDFLESVDQGLCMSMHQPWASLLVAGIKMHEGRTWKTEHRGRLWIAAAAKEPEDEEILACEEMYRSLYDDDSLEFPRKYPTGCLLGCVIVDDCLDQKTYREKYPNGESSSPFVFICSSPVILPIFYPMQGQHKIFSLGKDMHRTAKAALMSSKWV